MIDSSQDNPANVTQERDALRSKLVEAFHRVSLEGGGFDKHMVSTAGSLRMFAGYFGKGTRRTIGVKYPKMI